MTEGSTIATPGKADDKPFISYSANAEDVILHRLFGGQEHGFYVDVGAAHPTFENDTRALYDQGWHGINLEPDGEFFTQLLADRPRDRNLQLAVSDESGTISYWHVVGTGLSTCDGEESARARRKGFEIRETSIRCATLAEILHEAQVTSIDLLKVDVEGFELRVLRGNDWTRFRPRVIIVEATYPQTPRRRPDEIRPFLEQNGYDFAYFDGLNDFFIERKFAVAEDAFLPPNMFDNYLPYAMLSLQEQAANLEKTRDVQDEFIRSLKRHLALHENEAAGLREKLAQMGLAETALRGELAGGRARETRLRGQVEQSRMHEIRSRDEAKRAIEAAQASGAHMMQLRGELERVTLAQAHLRDMLNAMQSETGDLRIKAQELHALKDETAALRTRTQRLEQVLDETYRSTSWRLSSPVRLLGRLLERSLGHSVRRH